MLRSWRVAGCCWCLYCVFIAHAWDSDQDYTLSDELYVVGDSCDAGWVPSQALKMSKAEGRHLFNITLRLKSSGYGIKMLRNQENWADDLGMLRESWNSYGPLGYGGRGKLEQVVEESIPPASVEAVYSLQVDLDEGRWWVICVDECESIDAAMPNPTNVTYNVSLVYSSKLRGHLLPYDPESGKSCTFEQALQPGCVGGLPYIAAHVRKLKEQGSLVVLVDAGEFFWGFDFLWDAPSIAGKLARAAGYNLLNCNSRDFRGGISEIKEFARSLGADIPLVLSNGNLEELNEVDGELGRSTVVGHAAVELAPGFTVGFLGLIASDISQQIEDFEVNQIRGDIVSTMARELHVLQETHRPLLIVVMNSLNYASEEQELGDSWSVNTLAEHLLGVDVIIGGGGFSRSPFSLTDLGPILNFGWLRGYGGQYIQQLDITVGTEGHILGFQYVTTKMDAEGVNITEDDEVLLEAYQAQELYTNSSDSLGTLGTSEVEFFFEGDPSLVLFDQEQAPMMSLLSHILYESCPSCTAAFVPTNLVDGGIPEGNIRRVAIETALPFTGTDIIVEVLEVSGAMLLEGAKSLFADTQILPNARGIRLSLLTTSGDTSYVTALQIARRDGSNTWCNFQRDATYKIVLPRYHRSTSTPEQWSSLEPVEELGKLVDLVASFIEDNSPLTADLVGPLGVVSSVTSLRSAFADLCTGSKDRQTYWDAGCWLTAGAFEEQAELLGFCEVGSFLTEDLQCSTCPTGTQGVVVATESDAFWSLPLADNLDSQPLRCTLCSEGTFRNSSMPATSCGNCLAGTYTEDLGSTVCKGCPDHSLQRETGQASCLCDYSFYKDPLDNTSTGSRLPCLPCEVIRSGSSTQYPGAATSDECICMSSTFLHDSSCVACFEGLDCSGGDAAPTQQAGYWSDEKELSVFRCRSTDECLEGTLGICAAGRTGRACDRCQDLHWPSSSGSCQPCSTLRRLALPSFTALCVGLFILITVKRVDFTRQRLSEVLLMSTLVQIFTALQSITAIGHMSITWTKPVSRLLSIFSVVVLDLDWLSTSCFLASDSRILKFALQLVLFPFVLLLALLVGRCLRHVYGCRPISSSQWLNAKGNVLFALFITISLTMLMPFQCAQNPNGLFSIMESPGIVCWSSAEHIQLLFLSIIGILVYPVGTLTWAIWVIRRYRNCGSSTVAVKLQIRHSFLLGRFRPDKYYYSIIYLVRNLCVALVPVVFAAIPWLQLTAMNAVLLVAVAVCSVQRPWRAEWLNRMELGINLYLILLLGGAAPLLEDTSEDVTAFVCTALIFAAVGLGIVLLWAMRPTCRGVSGSQQYGAFLSHHKERSGAFCRLVKTIARRRATMKPIFLDCDELNSLDGLLDVVRCKVENVVAVLTPGMLQRPWCAAEIATAHYNSVTMIPLRCTGFATSDAELSEGFQLWEWDHAALVGAGLTLEMVVMAYQALLSKDVVDLDRFGKLQYQEDVIAGMLRCCSSLPARSTRPTFGQSEAEPHILLLGSRKDPEDIATIGILQHLLQEQMQQLIKVIETPDEVQWAGMNATSMVVLLSDGLVDDEDFLLALVAAKRIPAMWRWLVTVLPDRGRFEFPSASALEQMKLGPSTSEYAEALRLALKVLAMPLSPLGSQEVLNQQVSEICRRRLVACPEREREWQRKNSEQHASNSSGRVNREGGSSVEEDCSRSIESPDLLGGSDILASQPEGSELEQPYAAYTVINLVSSSPPASVGPLEAASEPERQIAE